MQEELKTINASDLPGLADLAREVKTTRKPVRIVEDGGEELAVLQPTKNPQTSLQAKTAPIYTDVAAIPTLTDEEVAQAQEAMRQATAFRDQLRTQHGGKPFSESWPIIRAAREARSRQL